MIKKSIRIFYSYSHKDEEFRNELDKYLITLKKEGRIIGWHDRMINAGKVFDKEINIHLNKAQIILILLSQDFIASDYCYNTEMMCALERHKNNEARVIPVILKHCDWKNTPLKELLAIPRDGKPITTWTSIDEAFLDVAERIRVVIDEFDEFDEFDQLNEIPKKDDIGMGLNIANRIPKRLELYRKALSIDEDIYGTDHPTVAKGLNNIGMALKDAGDFKSALEYFERTLGIYKRHYGVDHPNVAVVLTNIGLVFSELGNKIVAKTYYEQALIIDENYYGTDHPTVAQDLNNIGMVLKDVGDLKKARDYLERSLEMYKKHYGTKHPEYAIALNNLGLVLID